MIGNPLVSICCITYNHEPFIRKCLDGFLMQETTFPVEILIHDDCSTDGTADIIREYADKYPDKIFPMYEEENQYSKGAWIDGYNYKRARGKYIAYCEGDDYWIDPQKLWKQVDFMEAHPEYSVCFTSFRNHVVKSDKYLEANPTRLLKDNGNPDGIDIDKDLFFQKWYTQPMTMLFRMSAFSFDWQRLYKHYRDMHEIYHLMNEGKCRLLNFDCGVRSMHEGGIASMIGQKKQLVVSEEIATELYENFRDKGTCRFYHDTMMWKLCFVRPFSWERVHYAWKVVQIDHNLKRFIKNITRQQSPI